jgi:hypothetical protein
MKRILAVFSFILCITSLHVIAQVDMKTTGQGGADLKQAGQTTMNFLQVNVSPRSAGMGAAYTSMAQGVESVFSNPAGLTEMESTFEGFFSSVNWFADIKYLAGAVAWNTRNYGAVALSAEVVDYGKITRTRLVPYASTGANYIIDGDMPNVGAYAIGITYVKAISDQFAIGGTAKYAGQQLGQLIDANGIATDNNATKYVFDMGVKYFTGIKSLRLGMSIRNFSTFVKYQSFQSPIPVEFSVGLGMNMLDLLNIEKSKDHKLFLALDFVHPNNYTDRVNVGVEYNFMNIISIRGGHQSNHDLLSWSSGMGLMCPIDGFTLHVDYAYSGTKNFGGIHRFSLGVAY